MISDIVYDMLPADWPKSIGDLPATAANAVGIVEYDGYNSTEYFQQTCPSIFSPVVKIVIRHASYEIGKQWADLVKSSLHRYHDDVVLSLLLVNDIIYLGRNNLKLHEFQITFKTNIKE